MAQGYQVHAPRTMRLPPSNDVSGDESPQHSPVVTHVDVPFEVVSVPRSGGNSGWTSGVEIPVT